MHQQPHTAHPPAHAPVWKMGRCWCRMSSRRAAPRRPSAPASPASCSALQSWVGARRLCGRGRGGAVGRQAEHRVDAEKRRHAGVRPRRLEARQPPPHLSPARSSRSADSALAALSEKSPSRAGTACAHPSTAAPACRGPGVADRRGSGRGGERRRDPSPRAPALPWPAAAARHASSRPPTARRTRAAQRVELLQQARGAQQQRVRPQAQVEERQALLVGLEHARGGHHQAPPRGPHRGARLPEPVHLRGEWRRR